MGRLRDHRHVDVGALERLGAEQPSEAGADHDHPVAVAPALAPGHGRLGVIASPLLSRRRLPLWRTCRNNASARSRLPAAGMASLTFRCHSPHLCGSHAVRRLTLLGWPRDATAPSASRRSAVVALGGRRRRRRPRWLLGEVPGRRRRFPWTTFAINVVGSVLLALLPALGRRTPPPAPATGARRRGARRVHDAVGVLGGEPGAARRRSADGSRRRTSLGTLAACLLGVALADRLSTPGGTRPVRVRGGRP